MAAEPSLTLGTPTMIADCSKLGLYSGFGREFAIGIDEKRILFDKSAVTIDGRIDVGITVTENWVAEFSK